MTKKVSNLVLFFFFFFFDSSSGFDYESSDVIFDDITYQNLVKSKSIFFETKVQLCNFMQKEKSFLFHFSHFSLKIFQFQATVYSIFSFVLKRTLLLK